MREKKTGNYKTLKLKVSGMHCEGCNKSIQKSLSKIDGIRNIQADFRNEDVRMELNERRVNLEKIRGAIRKAGFIPGVEQIGT
jgi:Cu+-exporting ATPase